MPHVENRAVARAPVRQQARHIALGSWVVSGAQARVVQPFLHIDDQQGGSVIGRYLDRLPSDLISPS